MRDWTRNGLWAIKGKRNTFV